jgi:two-component system nitrate/nitrite response regulator NarL
MTSSRTILIEANRLFRQGLKHLLADTRFAVEAEFSTTEQAIEGAVASGLLIVGEGGDLQQLRGATRKPASSCWPATSRWMPCATP